MSRVNHTLVKLKVQKSNKNTALLRGTITALIKEFLKRIGKLESFDAKNDYDSDFLKMSQKYFRKSPIRIEKIDQEGLILDALEKAMKSEGAKKFDPSKGSIQSFLGFFFQGRLLNGLLQFQKEKYREIQEREDTDFTVEEQQEFKRQKVEPEEETVEEVVEFKDMIKSLSKFIHSRRNVHGKGNVRLLPIFNLLLKDKSLTEIAKSLRISPAAVTKDLEKLKGLILEYARRENNEDLLKLMAENLRKKSTESAKDKDWLIDVFKEYKKKLGEVEREPVGDVIKVKKTIFEDKMTDEYITESLLSGDTDARGLESEQGELSEGLELQDEILQDDNGRIVGLRIVSEEVRKIN